MPHLSPAVHVSLNVSDIYRSSDFCTQLLGVPPAKRRPDYAKLELVEPRLVLTLNGAPDAALPDRAKSLGLTLTAVKSRVLSGRARLPKDIL